MMCARYFKSILLSAVLVLIWSSVATAQVKLKDLPKEVQDICRVLKTCQKQDTAACLKTLTKARPGPDSDDCWKETTGCARLTCLGLPDPGDAALKARLAKIEARTLNADACAAAAYAFGIDARACVKAARKNPPGSAGVCLRDKATCQGYACRNLKSGIITCLAPWTPVIQLAVQAAKPLTEASVLRLADISRVRQAPWLKATIAGLQARGRDLESCLASARSGKAVGACLGTVPLIGIAPTRRNPVVTRDGIEDVAGLCKIQRACAGEPDPGCEQYIKDNPARPREVAKLATCMSALAGSDSCYSIMRCLAGDLDIYRPARGWIAPDGAVDVAQMCSLGPRCDVDAARCKELLSRPELLSALRGCLWSASATCWTVARCMVDLQYEARRLD